MEEKSKDTSKPKVKPKWNTLEVWDCLIVMLLMAIWTCSNFSDGGLAGIPPAVVTGLGIFTPIYMVYFAICLICACKNRKTDNRARSTTGRDLP